MPSSSERFRPSDERLEELDRRARRAIDELHSGGYDVVGDVSLLEPSDVRDRRQPGEVTDSEQLDVAVEVIAALMTQVRGLRREVNALTRKREQGTSRVSVSRFLTGTIARTRKDDAR
jgi:hypothetical protein